MSTQLIPTMGKEEALTKTNQILALHSVSRELLLEIRDRKGWQSMGYKSFEEYGEKCFGYSLSYMQRLAKAAEIQHDIKSPKGEIPETQLRPLGKVAPKHRQAVFDHATQAATANNQQLTAKAVTDAVKDYIELLEAERAKTRDLASQLEETNGRIYELSAKKIEEGLQEKLQAKTQELQEQLEQRMEEVRQDYQAHIDDKTDTITRLKSELTQQRELANSIDPQKQAELGSINQQIAQKQAELDALTIQLPAEKNQFELVKTYADLFTELKDNTAGLLAQIADLKGTHQPILIPTGLKYLIGNALDQIQTAERSLEYLLNGNDRVLKFKD